MTLQWSLFVVFNTFIFLFSGASAKSSGHSGRGSSHSRSSSHSSHSHSSFHASSTHYYGGYTVGHYRGGGHSSSHRSTRPTISEKQIVDAIFVHSNQTFYTRLGNESFHYEEDSAKIPFRYFEHSNSTNHTSLHLIASKPDNGMRVNTDLVFYWGLEYLPKNESDCKSTDSSVGNSTCSNQNDVCLRSVSDIKLLSSYNFSTFTNASLTNLSWSCPFNQRCCDWECCEEAEISWVESAMILMFVIAMIVVAIRGRVLLSSTPINMWDPADSDTSDLQIVAAPSTSDTPVKRGRGRPPKGTKSTPKVKKESTGRPRGRPTKKKNVGKAKVEKKEKTVNDNGVKKRGKPSKKTETPKETNGEVNTEKRGRGRPRKA